MKRYLAEFIGTFVLVFAGTGAIVIDNLTGGAIGHVGISLTFGLAVMAMIFAIGDISGAHINPAVSFGFWLGRRLSARDMFGFVVAQILGAITASASLKVIFPGQASLGVTVPSGAPMQSFSLEIILTFILMFVILNVSTGAREKGVTAGIAVGGVIALEALFAGPISGASMNPARSIGPALASGHLHAQWIYVIAPVIGAGIGVLGCRCVRDSGCCTEQEVCSR